MYWPMPLSTKRQMGQVCGSFRRSAWSSKAVRLSAATVILTRPLSRRASAHCGMLDAIHHNIVAKHVRVLFVAHTGVLHDLDGRDVGRESDGDDAIETDARESVLDRGAGGLGREIAAPPALVDGVEQLDLPFFGQMAQAAIPDPRGIGLQEERPGLKPVLLPVTDETLPTGASAVLRNRPARGQVASDVGIAPELGEGVGFIHRRDG